ncbi:DNA polymerase sliding clamp subunit [Metallosphaera yellowstonensis MK1]|jgi:proliferating cell nuclear antigen|uniref:DNA polymerase sliding clamp n=1 Tax=Metallosphaera yellowstonensis MK1 TaxID=671065 RepID=H2C6X7_9CREN|nr:hypothetical protein [Metallosphaera yellowstonensis]EHP69554.1 DNA polymerase sliding clamp subunit [Metallosphaera yellowstonensis MK1]
MFRLIYGSSKDFYYIISSMSKITEKIILNFTDEGINSKHLTEDKVMMGVISVPRDALDEYSLDKPLSIELDLGEIKKIFAKAKSSRSSMEISETESGIRITVRDEKTGTRTNLYLKGAKAEPQVLKEPNVTPSTILVMKGETLKMLVDEGLEVGEEITLRSEAEEVIAEVEELGKRYVAHLRNSKPLSKLEIESPGSARYSLPVLEKLASTLNFSDELEVGFGSGIPLRTQVILDRGALIKFWVAPRL